MCSTSDNTLTIGVLTNDTLHGCKGSIVLGGVVAKGHTHLDKPVAFSFRFV